MAGFFTCFDVSFSKGIQTGWQRVKHGIRIIFHGVDIATEVLLAAP